MPSYSAPRRARGARRGGGPPRPSGDAASARSSRRPTFASRPVSTARCTASARAERGSKPAVSRTSPCSSGSGTASSARSSSAARRSSRPTCSAERRSWVWTSCHSRTRPRVQELVAQQPAVPAARQGAAAAAQVAPQREQREDVGALPGEAGVRGVGLRPRVHRPLARVRDAQPRRRRRGRRRARRASAAASTMRATRGSTGRRARRRPSGVRRAPCPEGVAAGRLVDLQRPELGEHGEPVGDRAALGRVEEREVLDAAEAERGHLQHDRGEVGALHLRLGLLGAAVVVGLRVQPDRDAVGHPAAAPGPLAGGRLADGLDGQPLDLRPAVPPADAGGPAVDDVADAGDRQRRLGDVGRQHDAPCPARRHDTLLLT